MYKFKLYGLGGQGVVTAGKLICLEYCKYENLYAKSLPDYGHERRKGVVFADVIIDHSPILINSFVYDPDIVIVFSPQIDDYLNVSNGIKSNSILILNSDTPDRKYVQDFHKCYYVNASRISLKHVHKDIPNIGILGALAKTGTLSLEHVLNVIEDCFSENSEQYKKIVREAYDETREN